MDHPPSRRIGLPWYRREDYGSLRAAMADPHVLASSYDAWLAAALNNEAVARQAGLDVSRIVLDAITFAAWCDARGRLADATARLDFVRETLERDPGVADPVVPPLCRP
jgi:hypothetical protein